MSEFDIVIVGGGIAGASLGARIAGKARVAIVEAEDHCGRHSTGRSAAFWLAHYGGAPIIPLSIPSREPLEQGWPAGEGSLLHRRGAIVIGREYRALWDALSVETDGTLYAGGSFPTFDLAYQQGFAAFTPTTPNDLIFSDGFE